MVDQQKLYVYENAFKIVTSFVSPDVTMTGRFKWTKRMYYHPEVEIFCGKFPNVRKRKTEALDQAIMQALQSEGIAVSTLRRQGRQGYTKRPKSKVSKKQLPLL